MARKLGYGGLGNTNGARDFTGKTPAVGVEVFGPYLMFIPDLGIDFYWGRFV